MSTWNFSLTLFAVGATMKVKRIVFGFVAVLVSACGETPSDPCAVPGDCACVVGEACPERCLVDRTCPVCADDASLPYCQLCTSDDVCDFGTECEWSSALGGRGCVAMATECGTCDSGETCVAQWCATPEETCLAGDAPQVCVGLETSAPSSEVLVGPWARTRPLDLGTSVPPWGGIALGQWWILATLAVRGGDTPAWPYYPRLAPPNTALYLRYVGAEDRHFVELRWGDSTDPDDWPDDLVVWDDVLESYLAADARPSNRGFDPWEEGFVSGYDEVPFPSPVDDRVIQLPLWFPRVIGATVEPETLRIVPGFEAPEGTFLVLGGYIPTPSLREMVSIFAYACSTVDPATRDAFVEDGVVPTPCCQAPAADDPLWCNMPFLWSDLLLGDRQFEPVTAGSLEFYSYDYLHPMTVEASQW